MNETTSQAGSPARRPATGLILIALVATILLLLAAGFAAYRTWSDQKPSDTFAASILNQESDTVADAIAAAASESAESVTVPEVTRLITESELEEEYGLRLRLLAVTAAGGLIDLRLKVVDAEKAGQLLGSNKPLPQLVVGKSDVILQAPADPDLNLEDGIMVFGLYPNSQHAVETGTPVSVQFGSMSLGPVIAQ